MEDAPEGEDDKGDDGSGSDEEGSEEGEIEESQPQDTEMKVEESVVIPATEPAQPIVPPVVKLVEEIVVQAEPTISELEPPDIEVVEAASAPVPESHAKEMTINTEPKPSLEPPSAPVKVDYLENLENAVADMEKEE